MSTFNPFERCDTQLNENGRKQAESLRLLKKLPLENNDVQLYSSPLKRALETCQIATMSAPDEIRMDERLMERDFGTWSGKKKIEMYDHLRNLNMDINDPMVSILSDEIETWTAFTERKRLFSTVMAGLPSWDLWTNSKFELAFEFNRYEE